MKIENGDYAFYNCTELISVFISDSVVLIRSNPFYNCKKLASINVNKYNNYFLSDDDILFDKNKATLIKYPPSKKNKEYIISNSVTKIGNGAFWNCENLKSIIIPNSIDKIRGGAFYNCKNLQSKKGNYKAFNKELACMNMQYTPNRWNKIEGDIKVCEWGLHYVTNLFDIFNYYSGDLEKDIEIWEVEIGDTIVNSNDDSKKATNAIKPIRKLAKQKIIDILNNK